MESIEVTTDFLRRLADLQAQTADEISSAAAPVDGLSERVELSHGTACAGSWSGLKNAVAERTEAVGALAQVSRQLAKRLLLGLDEYTTSDDTSGAVMGQQVRP